LSSKLTHLKKLFLNLLSSKLRSFFFIYSLKKNFPSFSYETNPPDVFKFIKIHLKLKNQCFFHVKKLKNVFLNFFLIFFLKKHIAMASFEKLITKLSFEYEV